MIERSNGFKPHGDINYYGLYDKDTSKAKRSAPIKRKKQCEARAGRHPKKKKGAEEATNRKMVERVTISAKCRAVKLQVQECNPWEETLDTRTAMHDK